MKSCEEILDVLPDHLPRLTGEALEVHEHLRGCHDCAEAADDLAHTLDALRRQSEPAPELRPDFADAVLAALPPAGAPAGRVLTPGWIPHVTRAAAAVALFTLGLGAARVMDGSAPREPQPVAQATPSPVRRAEARPQAQPRPQVATVPQRAGDAGPHLDYAGYGAPSSDGLERYVQEAGLVLRAVNALDRPDPRWLDAVALHIHEAALLEQGEQLLLALRGPSDEPQLRRLISGTQMLLLKLRNAQAAPASMRAVRIELRDTGLLEAYDALLTAGSADDSPTPEHGQTDPL